MMLDWNKPLTGAPRHWLQRPGSAIIPPADSGGGTESCLQNHFGELHAAGKTGQAQAGRAADRKEEQLTAPFRRPMIL
jgi:hypothetical protein